MRAPLAMLATCALIIGLGAVAFRRFEASHDPNAQGGIRIVNGVDGPAAWPTARPSAPAFDVRGAAAQSPATRSHYGAPVEKPDPLLDTALAQAPDDIAVRHRLLAMQLAADHDLATEQHMAARLAARWGVQARLIRVACSVSVCEIATDLPRLASQVASDAAAFSNNSVASCLSLDALPSWTNGTLAVRYVGRTAC